MLLGLLRTKLFWNSRLQGLWSLLGPEISAVAGPGGGVAITFQADSTETLAVLYLNCAAERNSRMVGLLPQGTDLRLRIEGSPPVLLVLRRPAYIKCSVCCGALKKSLMPWRWAPFLSQAMLRCSLALSQCITHLIGRPTKRSWKLFPGTVAAAAAGPDLPDRRL